jgi:hypothetical protein
MIKKDFSKKIAGKADAMILYNEAIAGMNVDLTAAALRDEVKWEVASSQAPKPIKRTNDQDTSSLTSKALSKLNEVRGPKHDGKKTKELDAISEDGWLQAKPVDKQ